MTTLPAPRCLIAEDEPLLAAGLRADLAALWPALVVAAEVGDGASAVAQALAWRPEVCFLDIRMPALWRSSSTAPSSRNRRSPTSTKAATFF